MRYKIEVGANSIYLHIKSLYIMKNLILFLALFLNASLLFSQENKQDTLKSDYYMTCHLYDIDYEENKLTPGQLLTVSGRYAKQSFKLNAVSVVTGITGVYLYSNGVSRRAIAMAWIDDPANKNSNKTRHWKEVDKGDQMMIIGGFIITGTAVMQSLSLIYKYKSYYTLQLAGNGITLKYDIK